MANPSRGEVEFVLGDKTFVVRPSFQNIREVEAALGSLFSIGRKITTNDFSITEMVTLIWIILRKEYKLKNDEVGEMVAAEGPVNLLLPISQFLTNAINPGKEVGDTTKGESKPTLN